MLTVSLTGGVDFNTSPLTATFASGAVVSRVSVPVFADSQIESNEQFDLMLTIPSSLREGLITMATGIIIDSTGTLMRSIILYRMLLYIVNFSYCEVPTIGLLS